ncbi:MULTISPECIES: DsbA family protein [unclassified Corynebacterium]|uniref:DsbA family protein n=1 Tax=unclassified Corynebacterium TaxID=2624378 RepID=UPI0029C9EBFE|nr:MULTISPECIES: thioredoxin domain-containing protein [unclassified Corynebacterium]WPF65687.1 thioredoxin domain-containing protein [Corynebacterium sp. 22KM0430]WPF68183.1 thioredoxin domain-containing protein [Corynebacterium sp. 21KM1197]
MKTRFDTYVNPQRPWYRTAPFYIVLAVLVIFLVVVLIAQFTGKESGPEPAASQSAAGATASDDPDAQIKALIERRDADDPRAIGDVDAPVVMVEWTDLRCPFCGLFSREILPVLKEEYVDTGKVRIEFRDVAYFGERSASASAAARAAAKQDKYVEYLQAIYARAPESGHPDLPESELIEVAEEVSVPDMARFKEDMKDPQLVAEAEEESNEARRLGVQGVPFFAVGSTVLTGAQPLDNFRGFLDQAIEEAS